MFNSENAKDTDRGYVACAENLKPVYPTSSIDKRSLWGLYCMYAIVGIVYGFQSGYMTLPICQYVFGPMGAPGRTSVQQCDIANTIAQMPWNLKLFYGIFLDRVNLLGSRRRNWIVFGWTTALVFLAVMSALSPHLVERGMFAEYTTLWMLACVFYMFADVAGDGMTIELSKTEAPEIRGRILTTGQLIRFSATLLTNILGTLAMNGPHYYAGYKDSDSETLFNFDLPFGTVHLVLVFMVLPFYVGMLTMLRDPPVANLEDHSLIDVTSTIWDLMQTKVFLFLVVYSLGSMAIAGLSSPASNIIQAIAAPSTLQSSIGGFVGNLLFLLGVALFRQFFMQWNWRFTFVWTGLLMSLGFCFDLMTIYNAWGIGQSGWFYAMSGNILSIIVGLAQVLSSLAVIEVSPPGYEATVYSFFTTLHNAGLSLNTNIQNLFVPVFDLNGISAESYFTSPLPTRDKLNHRLVSATYFTLVANLLGVLGFCLFAPRDKEDCKVWREDPAWRTRLVGVLVIIIGGGPSLFSLCVSFLSLFPATMCLKIAGGAGC